jgi:intracellular sulfur oxidation DsrE/DsrF family protein
MRTASSRAALLVVTLPPRVLLAAFAADVDRLVKAKVRFAACENTLRHKAIARDKLLPGVTTVPAGAVEVIRRQQAGFGYFRP